MGAKSQIPDYFVDFTTSSLQPSSSLQGYGPMKQGATNATVKAESYWKGGLNLSVYKAPATGATTPVSNSVYVVPPTPFPVASRILMRLEFERPWAQVNYVKQPARIKKGHPSPGGPRNTVPTPIPAGEPWAVALNVKVGNENDIDAEARIGVTCQFNLKGIRLNAPKSVESAYLMTLPEVSPYKNYEDYVSGNSAIPFSLEFEFLGFGAATGAAVGRAVLNVGNLQDTRLFSHKGLSGASSISAVGAAVVVSGTGQVMARLLNFSLHVG